MATTQHIIFETISGNAGDIAHITLNRPQALNALTHEMILSLGQQLQEWQENDAIKAVIITASGDRAFCAGGDIRHVYEKGPSDAESLSQFFRDEYSLNHLIHNYRKPYIALLDGITMGGGVGISIHGSHRIAAERLRFAMPETGIGFFPDIGSSYFLSRCHGKIGTYIGMSGAQLNTADALFSGLIDHFVPRDRFDELIEMLANTAFTAEGTVSDLIAQKQEPVEEAELASHSDKINHYFADNNVETIMANLAQDPEPWSQQLFENLDKKSPTSLKITLKQLNIGAELDFEHCMQMEFRLVNRFLKNHDFYEGIRAAIIDKDNQPQWHPKDLATVTAEEVAKYFVPLNNSELVFYN